MCGLLTVYHATHSRNRIRCRSLGGIYLHAKAVGIAVQNECRRVRGCAEPGTIHHSAGPQHGFLRPGGRERGVEPQDRLHAEPPRANGYLFDAGPRARVSLDQTSQTANSPTPGVFLERCSHSLTSLHGIPRLIEVHVYPTREPVEPTCLRRDIRRRPGVEQPRQVVE